MKIRFDWKFWIPLGVTLASVIVPVWLWQADLTARSLHFKKISQTSLQLPATAKALDLKISAADAELPSPYLTVFELINDGAKPVPSSDFESPIEIIPSNAATVIRTSINGTNPRDLTPAVSVDAGLISIKPMLFNPGDSVTIAVLTTGEEPIFSSRARIVGIHTVPIIDAQPKAKISILFSLAMLLTALISFVALNLVLGGWPSAGVHLRPRSAFLIFILADGAAAVSIFAGLESFGVTGYLPILATLGCGVLVTGFMANWLNRAEAPVAISSDQSAS
ncbi:hypothetical protein ACIQW9_00575 [Herminiimonas sp. NPDC097707]|uniref:hypothetical protein n=1 Tax=Herminiimonas sp. NPDC097707 TaxID=3364007 RepID=UPI003839D974